MRNVTRRSYIWTLGLQVMMPGFFVFWVLFLFFCLFWWGSYGTLGGTALLGEVCSWEHLLGIHSLIRFQFMPCFMLAAET